ncbi:hypothetical protein BDR06DRAFT_1013554 [Suillus hirtellus]|nr:hypothetical protein BDR06DRAFT_1013554 [Suillus hirtellus]
MKTFSVLNEHVRNLARAMLEWGKHTGSIIVVYLAAHEHNMTAVWACLLAGYLPCLQPALSTQRVHKEGHAAHIKELFESATWPTSEFGAEQITFIFGLEVLLLSELKSSREKFTVAADWVAYEAKPDNDATLFLTSGSTGFSKASIQLAFGSNFLLSKLTRDLDKHIDLFGTARAFVTVMQKLSKNPRVLYNRPWVRNDRAPDAFTISAHNRACSEFLDLRHPLGGCEMRIVDPANGVTLYPDVFVRYYNNAKATSYGFVQGGWFRTGYVGMIENGVMRLGGRIKDTIIVCGISYSIPELETYLQIVEWVVHSFLAAAPFRALGQQTEGFIGFQANAFSRLKREGEKHFNLHDIPAIQILKHPVLSSLAQNETPFYAFRARGFDSGHSPFTSMDGMATVPYTIAGYSYGGVVAFEIAKQLEAMGEEVKFFAPINIPPSISDRMAQVMTGWSCGEASYILVPEENTTLMDFEYVPQFQEILHSRLEARGL